MRGLDDTDREILALLLEDARRPYSDIAEEVGLSAPAVSDRVERLQEIGLVRRFTVDVDRSLLAGGVPLLVTVRSTPGSGDSVRKVLAEDSRVEFLFQTVDETVVCTIEAPDGDVDDLLAALPEDAVRGYDVRLLRETEWTPRVGDVELAPECVECGNTVSREGERERLDGEVYHFCCSSCRDAFLERYDQFSESA